MPRGPSDLRRRIFGRLRVVEPLRDRIEDLPALADWFAGRVRLSPEVTQLLSRLRWPGNVRELKNVIERITSAASPISARIRLSDILPELVTGASRRPLSRFERAECLA